MSLQVIDPTFDIVSYCVLNQSMPEKHSEDSLSASLYVHTYICTVAFVYFIPLSSFIILSRQDRTQKLDYQSLVLQYPPRSLLRTQSSWTFSGAEMKMQAIVEWACKPRICKSNRLFQSQKRSFSNLDSIRLSGVELPLCHNIDLSSNSKLWQTRPCHNIELSQAHTAFFSPRQDE